MTSYIKRNMAVMFAIFIMGIAAFAIVSAQPVYAAEDDIAGGVYDGVPWRITSKWELIIGEEGQEYTFDYRESRGAQSYPWYSIGPSTARFEGTVYGNGSMAGMFDGYNQYTLASLDLSGFDTSNVTDMSYMFLDCNSLTSLDVSEFDTSNVTNMYAMFQDCRSLTSLDLSNFKTNNVPDMSYMFYNCSSLAELDVSSFDTSNVTDMSKMFYNCRSLTELDVSGFSTGNVTGMNEMFYRCHSLTELDLSNFDTSKVGGMEFMFFGCRSLTELDVSAFDTRNVTLMDQMFQGCSSLTELDLSNFDASNVSFMKAMFNENNNLTTLKIGKNFNTAVNGSVYGRYATFPVAMYDSITGTKYEADSNIPSTDYRIYVADLGAACAWEKDVAFKYDKSYKKASFGEATVRYKNDFFFSDNNEYNHELATASLALAMAGMTKANVEDFFLDIDFNTNIEQSSRYETPLTDDQDKVAYNFAMKEINGQNVISIVLRGGNYGNEWGSNGRVGCAGGVYGYHYGFNKAANDVILNLKSYCKKYHINLAQSKIWLTGYSRSAAVANCVGAKLEKEGSIDKSNLYCYTFATPRTVTEEQVYGSAQGIYNIVNPLDIVTCVPLNSSTSVEIFTHFAAKGKEKPWNYTRHGETLELPSAIGTKGYFTALKLMKQEFSDLTDGEHKYIRLEGFVLQGLLDILSTTTLSEENYVLFLQDQIVVPALEAEFLTGEGITNDTAMLAAISWIPGARAMLKAKRLLGGELQASSLAEDDPFFMRQHWSETYLAWMNTKIEPKAPAPIKAFFVQCPVDVEVYDSENDLVAKITNDTVDESIEGHLEAYVDEAGAKAVSMPADGEYSVKLIATGDGEMTYSVYETDNNRQVQRKVIYEDIEIQKNQEFTGEINDELNTDADNYDLESNGETIGSTGDYSGDELGNIEIAVEVSGPGVVSGEGCYTTGDSVVLQACEEDNSTFEGWYEDGTLVSAETILTFKADTSKSYTAKFAAKPQAPSNPCAKGHSWTHIVNNAGFLTNGNEYDQCTVCGIQQNQATIPGYASYYVKGMKVAKGKGSLTVKWKKQSKKNLKKFNGYQIRYATKSDMSDAKYKTAGKKATSKKIGKLKKKTKYFVQVRTYTKKNGTTFYSKWSAKKKVKTK